MSSGTGRSADGGEASSTAFGQNGGDATVAVTSTARGGNGRIGANPSLGGQANARATGIGGGAVVAIATADAGSDARADSLANASSVFSGDPVVSLHTTASAIGYRLASTRASNSRNSPAPTTSMAMAGQADALAAAMPDADETEGALSGSAGRESVAQNFDVGGSSEVLGIVALGGTQSSSADGTPMVQSARADFEIDLSQLSNPQDLLVGLLQPQVSQHAFNSLQFQIVLEGTSVIDETFTDSVAARQFFDGQTIDFGAISTLTADGILNLDFVLNMTSSHGGDGFAFDLLFGSSVIGAAVPAPPAVLSPAFSYRGLDCD